MMKKVVGILLAGGKSSRMGGGDKCLKKLGNKTILEHVIARSFPQVEKLILNVNGQYSEYARYKLPIVSDVVAGHCGPLAGILTGMSWVKKNLPSCKWLVSLPTDAPFFPNNLVEKLFSALEENKARISYACSHGRNHPVFGLWPVDLEEDLRRSIVEDKVRKIEFWTNKFTTSRAEFVSRSFDPFFNINNREQLEKAKGMIRELLLDNC